MTLHATLDTLATTLERATSVPLSASCLVHRGELLALVEQARQELPDELDEATALLADREVLLDQADRHARTLLERARRESEVLVDQDTVVTAARERAEEILDAARIEAARLLRDADDYCDRRLAAFEQDLTRTLGQVRRGRDRLRERSDLGGLADAGGELPTRPGGDREQVLDLTCLEDAGLGQPAPVQ